MSDQIEIGIKLDAAQAQQLLKDIGVELSKTKEKADSASKSMSFNDAKQGAQDFVGIVGQIAAGIEKIARAAAESEQNARAVTALGAGWDQVRAATNDTLTAQQALTAHQSLLQSGLRVSGEDFALIARKAREFAIATGTDTTQALGQLTDALRGGEAEGLRRFGLSADATGNRVRGLEGDMRELHQQLDGTSPAARTMTEDLDLLKRSVSDLAGDLATGAGTAFAGFAGWIDALGRADGVPAVEISIRNLTLAFRQLHDQSSDAANGARFNEAGAARAELAERYNEMRRRAAAAGVATPRADQLSNTEIAAMNERMANATRQSEYAGIVSGIRGAQQDRVLGDAQNSALDAAYAQSQQSADVRRAERPTHAQSGRADTTAQDQERQSREMVERLRVLERNAKGLLDIQEEFRVHAQEMAIAEHERLEAIFAQQNAIRTTSALWQAQYADADRLYALQRDGMASFGHAGMGNAEVLERLNRLREEEIALVGREDVGSRVRVAQIHAEQQAYQSVATANQAYARTVHESNDVGRQFAKSFSGMADLTQTSAQSMASVAAGAFSTMTGALRSHIKAVIEGKETIGEAMRGIVHDTLLNLATESAVQAVFSTAKGLAHLALQDYPGAALDFAAAGGFAAVAALGGLGAAATAPSASAKPPSATASSAPASAGGSSRSSGGGEGSPMYVFNVGGDIVSGEKLVELMHRSTKNANRRGIGAG